MNKGHLIADTYIEAEPETREGRTLQSRLIALQLEQRHIETQIVARYGVEQAARILIAAFDTARAAYLGDQKARRGKE